VSNSARCLTCDERSTARTDFCKNCGANINHWSARPLADVQARVGRLDKYRARMGNLRLRGRGRR
jgi:predicted amidophosphoribosyltransferase